MKAILMAAGMGTRISSETNKPKSLLPLGDESLLHRTVRLLNKRGIDIVIVTGFKEQHIVHELEDMNVKIYFNPFYRITNSIASLWLARDELRDDDIILMNADVYLSEDLLDEIILEKKAMTMFADKSRVKEGDYFFKTVDNKLVDYGKELKENERNCEYIGVAKLRKEILVDFVHKLKELIKAEKYNYWWENILYEISKDTPIYVNDTCGCFWGEVDTKEDYRRILEYVKNK